MRYLAIILLLLMPTMASAQCVGVCSKIVSISSNQVDGKIDIITEYSIDGVIIYKGLTRYRDNGKTDQDIATLIDEDLASQRIKLIQSIPDNKNFIKEQIRLKNESDNSDLLNYLITNKLNEEQGSTEYTEIVGSKEVKVTYDKKNTVTDIVTP